MGLNNIDFLVYQYINEYENDYMNYLKDNNYTSLVKNYSIDMRYTWELVEKITEKYNFKLIKIQQNEKFQCSISTMDNESIEYKEGYAESEFPAMAVCLAILDFFGIKSLYINESNQIIKEVKDYREARRKELEELLSKNNLK